MKPAVFLAVAVSVALTACQGRRFEPSWSVSDFRVLGISAEPPEVRPGGSTTLRALTYAPDGEVSYRWEWCPFETSSSDLYACPLTHEELEAQIAENLPDNVPADLFSLPDFDLGTEPEVTLEYPLPQPLLLAFCEALKQQAAEALEGNEELAGALPTATCDEGYDVSVRLVARNAAEPATDEMLENLLEQDPGEVIVASKKVTLWLQSENDQDLNPIHSGVEIRPKYEEDLEMLRDAGHEWVANIEDTEDDWYSVAADEVVPILVGVRYELRALVEGSSIQTFRKVAPQGTDVRYQEPETEVLQFDWYTTAGALDPNDAFYVEGRTPLGEVAVTTFHIPTTDTSQAFGGANGQRFIDRCDELDDNSDTGCEVRIWNVVRDSRRGINWIERRLLATGIAEDATRESPFEAGEPGL